MAKRSEPRLLICDIETLPDLKEVLRVFPQLSNFPGLTLKASICSIICFGYRWFGEPGKASVINAWDTDRWLKNVNDDSALVEQARDLFLEADAVITHNGKRFDWKFFQTRLVKNGHAPLPKIPHIDTCSLAKQHLFLFNNKLNTLGKFFLNDEKLENGGWDLWVKVHDRDPDAMELMSKYCKKDVDLLNDVYKIVRPFSALIPNYNLYLTGQTKVCPSCGSTRLRNVGYRSTKTTTYVRYQCQDCGSWSRTDASDRLPRSF